MSNTSFDNWCMIKYYIFYGLFGLIWSTAALGFTYLTVIYFKTPWCLLFTGLVFFNPCTKLNLTIKKALDKDDHKPSDYGSNNPS